MYQTIALYILKLANVICQLYLNTARGEIFTLSKVEGKWKHEHREGSTSMLRRSGSGEPRSQWFPLG